MEDKPNKQGRASNPFPMMEEQVLEFWDRAEIFRKSVEKEAPNGQYVFYDGPPFATGTPHYGHIVASTMKDVVPRFWTMRGYKIERKWGWDCHGLPIENIVEKELGSKTKRDLEKIGVEKFNKLCRQRIFGYVEDWERIIRRLGRWADMKNAYRTMDLSFMESVWWVFKQLYDKGLIYEGFRSMHICPRCETTLSQSEVAEGYKDIKDLSAIVKFELDDEPDTYVLAWTTTPWTLIGNAALAVGKGIPYSILSIKGEKVRYVIAKEKVEEVVRGKDYIIEKEVRGSDLIGKTYKPLFDYYYKDQNLENKENGWKIYDADFVTTDEGTGVVHIAPAFGEDDLNLGREKNLPFVQHVALDGSIKPEAAYFAGMNVKPIENHVSTDIEIIKYLASHGTLFLKEKYEHSYPHCWRCDTPLINYATSSWFVEVVKIKDELLKNAEPINWSPAHMKEGRFGSWLKGARDWSISRQRYWASVMPIWKCSGTAGCENQAANSMKDRQAAGNNCGHVKVIGSVAELEGLCGEKISDLHKDVVDRVTFKCEKCNGEMRRIPDVLDTWFDSGSMPYGQMHYPFENKEKFETNFPAQFIAEGQDQCRAWFYYLHVIGTGVMGRNAFNNVIVNGIVLAEDGRKMSKKLQNYPDPSLIFDKYGSDALRHYLISSPVMMAENVNFSEKGVEESLRKNVMILWNVYKFFELFSTTNEQLEKAKQENVLDRWIKARLNESISEVTKHMDAYDLPRAIRPITSFINDLSTWYIRRSRDRFKGADIKEMRAVHATTREVLIEFSKIIAPFMPFIAEMIWQKVTGHDFKDVNRSVHLEEWPEGFPNFDSKSSNEILGDMDTVRKIVELGLAKRDQAGIKIRQPLNKLLIKSEKLKVGDQYIEIIKDELNIKNIEVAMIGGQIEVEIDTELTGDLRAEGIMREIVRFVNALRKEAGLTINDRVGLYLFSEDEEINRAIDSHADAIRTSTLASSFRPEKSKDAGFGKTVQVNGAAVWIGIKK